MNWLWRESAPRRPALVDALLELCDEYFELLGKRGGQRAFKMMPKSQEEPGQFSSDVVLKIIEEIGLTGVWSKNLLTGEEFWSPGLYRLLGEFGSDKGTNLDRLLQSVHPEDRDWVKSRADVEFHALPSEARIRLIQKSGFMRWVNIRSQIIFTPAGKPKSIFYVIVDVTEHQQAIEALDRLDEQLDALAETYRISLYTIHPETEEVYIRNWKSLGLPSGADHSGRKFLDGVLPADRERAEQHRFETMRAGKPTTIRYRRISVVTGEKLDMIFFARPLLEKSGKIREWICLCAQLDRNLDFSNFPVSLKGAHIRAARALLDWPVEELAKRSGVSTSTIRRMESESSVSIRSDNLRLVREALENGGAAFFVTHYDTTTVGLREPGNRLHDISK